MKTRSRILLVKRRLLAPPVLQASTTDCGVAALKCLLDGFRIRVTLDDVREALQVGPDGSSIDALEDTAHDFGLHAEQVLLPIDHVLLPEARTLPCVIVTQLPTGETHFVVLWRRLGPYVQCMDPLTGRSWCKGSRLLTVSYVHSVRLPAATWREFAGSQEFLGALRRRLERLGVPRTTAAEFIAAGLSDQGWQAIGCLDAATRLAEAEARARVVPRGPGSVMRLKALLDSSRDKGPAGETIADQHWSVSPGSGEPRGEEQLVVRGALLVRVRGLQVRPDLMGR